MELRHFLPLIPHSLSYNNFGVLYNCRDGTRPGRFDVKKLKMLIELNSATTTASLMLQLRDDMNDAATKSSVVNFLIDCLRVHDMTKMKEAETEMELDESEVEGETHHHNNSPLKNSLHHHYDINPDSKKLIEEHPNEFLSTNVIELIFKIFDIGPIIDLQTLTDMMQNAGEESGSMRLDDEVYDDVVSIEVVRTFMKGFCGGVEGLMDELGV